MIGSDIICNQCKHISGLHFWVHQIGFCRDERLASICT